MKLNDFKISHRLFASFAVLLIFLIIISVISLNSSGKIFDNLKEIQEVSLPGLDYLIEADRDLQQMLVAERSLLLVDKSSDEYQNLLNDYIENSDQAKTRFNKYAALAQ